jgi:DNA replication protein DnaC
VNNQKGTYPLVSTGNYCDKHGEEQYEFLSNGIDHDLCEGCRIAEQERREKEISYHALVSYPKLKTKNRIDEQSVLSDKTILKRTLENYTTNEQEQRANLNATIQAKNEIIAGKVTNLWYVGEPGVGKSHLAMGLLRKLNEETDLIKGCLFVSFEEMLRLIRDSYNKNNDSQYTEESFIRLCSEVDYLVIDDLGAEVGAIDTSKRASDYVSRVLYAITNARQSNVTIITTNLTSANLYRIYDKKLISRLLANHKIIKFSNTVDQRAKEADF